jgi:uroporphyrinogen-III synthase
MRVLVTRPQKHAPEFARALSAIGAQAFFLPTIEIRPVADTSTLDQAISRLNCYDWLVLTSANAVDVFVERKDALGIESLPSDLRVAAVGPKTAARLMIEDITPDFIPQEYVAEAILPGMGELRGRWVLLPTADIAHDTLPRAIQAADGIAHVITAYHTLPAEPDPQGFAALKAGVDVITFTSGSAVRNFVVLARRAGLDPLRLPGNPGIACIGPKTAQAAREAGFRVDIVAESYTVDGLVEAISAQKDRFNHHDPF